MRNRKRLIGIVGAGNIFIHHVNAVKSNSVFEIAKVYDINPKMRAMTEELGIMFCEKYEEILNDPKVEVITVAVPLKHHFRVAQKAILAGKHVLLEKPPTETVGHLSILERKARQNKVLLVTALHASFGLEIMEFLKKIEIRKDGTYHTCYGKIKNIRVEMYDPYNEEVIPEKASALGGSWFDSGINALSVIRSIVPRIEIKSAKFKLIRFPVGLIEVQGEVKFEFPGGTGTINTGWLKGPNLKKSTIDFDNAKIILHHSNESIYHDSESSEPLVNCRNANPRLTNHYIGVYNHLARCLKRGKDNSALSSELLNHLLSALR